MASAGVGQPVGVALIVDAVPEPVGAGDLVLPLLQRLAVHQPGAEASLRGVLALRAVTAICGDPLPSGSGIGGCSRADRLPAVDSITRRVAEVPAARGRRRSDTLFSLGHCLVDDGLDSGTLGLKGPGPLQAPDKPRISMHLGRCPPLADELAHGGIVVELGGPREASSRSPQRSATPAAGFSVPCPALQYAHQKGFDIPCAHSRSSLRETALPDDRGA